MTQNIPGIKTTSGLKADPIAGQNQPLRHWMNSAGVVDWSNRSVPSAANLDGEGCL